MNDGIVIRDRHESLVRPGQELFTTVQIAKSASAGARPGILVLSRGGRLLYMNSRALELTGHLNQAEIGPGHNIRSAPVRELIAQIQETLNYRREADIWEIFELKRVIVETERRIMVRGFGLADRNSHDDSRIVIVLEEVGYRQKHKTQPTPGMGVPGTRNEIEKSKETRQVADR
jgi:PAS domain-containing protein